MNESLILPEYVYHGTSAKNLIDIEKEGIASPSYWAKDFEQALSYANSFSDGVVLCCRVEDNEFEANMLVAQCLYDDGDIDELPDSSDLEYSLEYYEGIVAHNIIRHYDIVSQPKNSFKIKP